MRIVDRMPNAQLRNRATSPPRPARRVANVTLPEPLVQEANALGINISQACEKGLAAAVSEARRVVWLKENRSAIDAWNEYIEEHGIPLSEFRQF
jgi:antitoxin CcdA